MGLRAPYLLAVLAAAITCASTPARVETWPERPVKIIVPLPAGGATDLAARL
jgi:tripartite-type tricarboxylate transporter receptor subunit TctC